MGSKESSKGMAKNEVERSLLRAVVIAACVLSPAVAAAQAPAGGGQASDKAAADALFDEGRRLVAAGKFAEACPKFEGAERLRPGIGTMLNLADCYEKLGKTASAWAMFRDAAVGAQRAGDNRESLAKDRVAALEPRLLKLTIVVPKESDVAGLEILRDGKPVDRGTWGTAIPLDPATYAIEAHAPGKQTWTGQANLTSSSTTVNVPVLERDESAAGGVGAGAGAGAGAGGGAGEGGQKAGAETATGGSPSDGSTQRTIALVVAGAGIAGVAVGAVFGLKSKSSHDDATAHCAGPNETLCDPQGVASGNDAISAGNVSTIAFAVGGVAVAAGAVLWLTAPSSRGASPSAPRSGLLLAPTLGGAALRGSW